MCSWLNRLQSGPSGGSRNSFDIGHLPKQSFPVTWGDALLSFVLVACIAAGSLQPSLFQHESHAVVRIIFCRMRAQCDATTNWQASGNLFGKSSLGKYI